MPIRDSVRRHEQAPLIFKVSRTGPPDSAASVMDLDETSGIYAFNSLIFLPTAPGPKLI